MVYCIVQHERHEINTCFMTGHDMQILLDVLGPKCHAKPFHPGQLTGEGSILLTHSQLIPIYHNVHAISMFGF